MLQRAEIGIVSLDARSAVTRSQHIGVAHVTTRAEFVKTALVRGACRVARAAVDPTPTNVPTIDRCPRPTRGARRTAHRQPAPRAKFHSRQCPCEAESARV